MFKKINYFRDKNYVVEMSFQLAKFKVNTFYTK
jgi:hypothetical protein